MDEYGRNEEIRHLLTLWSWCSPVLHVKRERERKYLNSCLMGINWAVNESRSGDKIDLFELARVYHSLPFPLISETGLLAF